jgi:hypothetical protein
VIALHSLPPFPASFVLMTFLLYFMLRIQVIQRFQNKVLKCIVQAPWYIRNSDLQRDLGIETVTDIVTRFASSHKKRLQNHIKSEVSRLLNVQNIPRRLKPFALVKQ